MQRLRFYDMRMSRLPEAVGLCKADFIGLANYVNSSQRNLLQAPEAGDEGWWGTWAEIAFNVSRTSPYYTAPRGVARLEVAAVCQEPVPIYNQFEEYLDFGNGRLPKLFRTRCGPRIITIHSRNSVPTFVDLPGTTPQTILVTNSEGADVGKRVLFSGTDGNGNQITGLDGRNPITGIFLSLAQPFATLPITMLSIDGIQKDTTVGRVLIYGVDPSTGVQTLLLTMEPSETTAAYRRYYFDSLPLNCCQTNQAGTVSVTAIAKLDLIPVSSDTDYCLIQDPEAIINESQSIRYDGMDTMTAKKMAVTHHRKAIQSLNGQLGHYLGVQSPVVNFRPFGSARLERRKIGTLI